MNRFNNIKLLLFLVLLLLIIACKFTVSSTWKKDQALEQALDQDLIIYPSIKGIDRSTRFSSSVYDGSKWSELFTMETIGPERVRDGITYRGVYKNNTGISSSWSTFETRIPVKVKVTRLSGDKITQCIIRPLSRNLKPEIVEDGKAVIVDVPLRLAEKKQVPVNIVFEFNGNQEETMSMFISPHLGNKPAPDSPGVFKVFPGTAPPQSGDWHTLYFMPGVHDLGKKAHPVQPGRKYYIPGNAWIDGGFMGKKAHNARVFGLGVICGRKITWEEVGQKKADKLMFLGGRNSILEGVTFIDSPHHTLFGGSDDPKSPSIIRNIKTHNWRCNTDGIHFFGSGIAEDCFIHGADDAHYLASRSDMVRFRRMVYWTDKGFGVHIIFSANGDQISPNNSIAEDCDSIYYNRIWGGSIIDQRGLKPGNWIDGAVIRDLRIEDPPANGPVIQLRLPDYKCTFKNILLKDITIYSNNDYPIEVTGGGPDSVIENITFENIKVEGKYIEKITPETFTLSFVKNIRLVKDGKTLDTYSSDIQADIRHIRPDPNNLLKNPGFEIAGYGWRGLRCDSDIIKPKAGNYCYKARLPAKEFGNFVQVIKDGLQDGGSGKYRLTAWFYIPNGKAKGNLGISWGLVNRKTTQKTRDERSIKAVPLVPGKWTKVSGIIDFPFDREKYPDVRWANFGAKASGKFDELYIDDVSMVKIED